MKKIIIYFLIISTVISVWSCKKSLLELKSQSAYDYNSYFTNSAALNQATIATYAVLLQQGLWSREYYFIFDLMGMEAKPTGNLQGDFRNLFSYHFGSDQPEIGQLWGSLYRMIFRANVVIDRVNAWNPTVAADQQNAKQYIAEVRFLRDYAYFNIVNLWGDAPLITSYDSVLTSNYASRAPAASLWAFIESDLTAAIPDLPVTYATADLGRATQGAAIALLGKTYLYEKKWTNAQTAFTQLTQSPFTYSLDPSYDNLFSENNQNSPEDIFQVMNAAWDPSNGSSQYYEFGGQETWGGITTLSDRAQEYGFKDWWNTYVTTTAVNAFHYASPANGTPYVDPRAYSTFYGNKASGGDTVYCEHCTTGKISYPFNALDPQGDYSWRKYEYYDQVATYGGPGSAINAQVIRYADVLLMLAETYIQQGITTGPPLDLINQVRARAGAVPYTTLGSQDNAMAVLMLERQLELCGEQSRYFDLIRWGIAQQTINGEMTAEPGLTGALQPFETKNLLFPIPDVEKDYNPNVNVSNGWN
ncbi:MAG: RagB/SusD family nutrient uptake outer membrane protein [Puia sp.]